MNTSAKIASKTSTSPKSAENISKTIGYYGSFIAFGLVAAVLGPTLPALAAHTQTDLSKISFLFTARSFGFLLGANRGGRLYDRVPGHPLLAGVLIMMAVMAAMIPLVSMLWLVTVLILILGVGQGMLEVGGDTLLIWVHRDKVGPFMNGLHFFFGVGASLSPILVARSMSMSGDVTWAYWILALLMLPTTIWLLRLSSPKIEGSSQDAPVGRIAHLSIVLLVTVFYLLYVGAEVSFGGWIYTYTVTLKLSSEAAAAYLASAFWGSITLGRLLAIPICLRFRPRIVLIVDFVGCLISIGIILLWSSSLTAVWLGTLGAGLSMASMFPTMLAFAGRRITITGRINGWFFAGSGLGGMFVPWLIGQLFEPVGPRITMLIIMGALIVAAGIFAALCGYPVEDIRMKSGC